MIKIRKQFQEPTPIIRTVSERELASYEKKMQPLSDNIYANKMNALSFKSVVVSSAANANELIFIRSSLD